MSLNLEVCEKCGAYYDTSKWNTYFMESTHENWHREQEYAFTQLTALIKGEQK